MVVAVRVSPPVKGKVPKLNMLELVSVVNKRYKSSKLRTRHLAEGYCYVCGRFDPSGIFRKPNGHLYKKGFLHACEHFPKAPFTTFVHDEIPIHDDDGGDSLVDFAVDKNETISVTIRRGSKSTGFSSSTEEKSGASHNKFKLNTDQFTARKFKLPSLTHDADEDLVTNPDINQSTVRKFKAFRNLSAAQKGFLRHSIGKTEYNHTQSEPNSVRNHDAAKLADSNQTSARSIFTEDNLAAKSARSNDLDALFAPSGRSLVNKPFAASMNSVFKLPEALCEGLFINQSDGLQNAFTAEPLIREVVVIDEHREQARRLKARFQQERKLKERHAHSEHSTSTFRPGSGHLRYHHRMNEDSVPDPGFDIPPTPLDDVKDVEKLEQEDDIDKHKSTTNGFNMTTGVKGEENDINKTKTNDLNITSGVLNKDKDQTESEKAAKHKKRSGVSSESRSFCRCATDLREVSFTRNVCRTCGKDCTLRNSSSGGSSQGYFRSGKEGNVASKSGRFRPANLKMSEEEQIKMYGMSARNKAFRNKDLLSQDSTIHEYEDELWSSDEEFISEESPVSWLRHSKPYQSINPDIHKQAYVDALQAAHMKGKTRVEDFEIDELKMLRRPNVFSYIPLLPLKDKQNTKYIGIRPDDSARPKNGQYMKHIFGEVRLDDFYPRFKPVKGGKIIIDDLAKTSSTEQTASKGSEIPTTGRDRSSVSFKMRSQGISFETED